MPTGRSEHKLILSVAKLALLLQISFCRKLWTLVTQQSYRSKGLPDTQSSAQIYHTRMHATLLSFKVAFDFPCWYRQTDLFEYLEDSINFLYAAILESSVLKSLHIKILFALVSSCNKAHVSKPIWNWLDHGFRASCIAQLSPSYIMSSYLIFRSSRYWICKSNIFGSSPVAKEI